MPHTHNDTWEAQKWRSLTAGLPSEVVAKIRDDLHAHLAALSKSSIQEKARQEKRIARLKDEPAKLLRAHYDNAIPLDLLKSEQERIIRELFDAEQILDLTLRNVDRLEEALMRALDLVERYHEVYAQAAPKLRRQINQALFERVLVEDGEVTGAEFTPGSLP